MRAYASPRISPAYKAICANMRPAHIARLQGDMRAYARPRISPAYKAICAGQAVARQQTLARTLPLLVGLSSLNLTILVISWLFRKKRIQGS